MDNHRFEDVGHGFDGIPTRAELASEGGGSGDDYGCVLASARREVGVEAASDEGRESPCLRSRISEEE